MRRARTAGTVLLLPQLAGLALATDAPAFVVIVHPQNVTATLNRKFLSNAFLKKETRWDGGEVIRPVDRNADAPVRERFSQHVHKRSAAAVRIYWQQQIFCGRGVPPPELASDDEVVKFVLQHPGAIGYISGSAAHDGTKAIGIE